VIRPSRLTSLTIFLGDIGSWGAPMLSSLSENIAECYRRAEACALRASAESDPEIRTDFLDMERRWLSLARSYEVTELLTHFRMTAGRR
jgi:hypothetical protein